MTIEELAAVSQHEFETIRRRMATKDDLQALQAAIIQAIENLDVKLETYASGWNEDFERLDKRVEQIDHRVRA